MEYVNYEDLKHLIKYIKKHGGPSSPEGELGEEQEFLISAALNKLNQRLKEAKVSLEYIDDTIRKNMSDLEITTAAGLNDLNQKYISLDDTVDVLLTNQPWIGSVKKDEFEELSKVVAEAVALFDSKLLWGNESTYIKCDKSKTEEEALSGDENVIYFTTDTHSICLNGAIYSNCALQLSDMQQQILELQERINQLHPEDDVVTE